MKLFLVVVALLVFTACCAKVDPLEGLTEERAFEKLVLAFHKVYATEQEYEHRFNVFKRNIKIMQELNAKDPEAIYGVNQFSDLSPEEFSDRYLMKNFSAFNEGIEQKGLPQLTPMARAGPVGLPASHDWNSKGCVTNVYNQGSCGSCWAFSATENLESVACIVKKSGLRSFSMQELLDCETRGTCAGGYVDAAMGYGTSKGMMAFSAYPYTGSKGTCKYNAGAVIQKFSGWAYVERNRNENNIQNWVYTNGAPSVCVDAKTWQHYQGGVVTANCGTAIDHCVQLTGWTTLSGKLAWKVRNSWGAGWGSSGYIYIEIGKNLCAVAQLVLTAT